MSSSVGPLPAPLVAAEVDLRDFPDMMLDVRKLRDSRFGAEVTGEAFRAGVMLWCAAWHQVPAGSLPDDDIELGNLAGFGRVIDAWREVRQQALQGFVKCADGRLYHETVSEVANAAWRKRLEHFYSRALERFRKDHKDVPAADRPKPLTFDEWNGLRLSAGLPLEKADAAPEKAIASGNVPPEKTVLPAESGGGDRGIPAEIALKGEGEIRERESLKDNTSTPDGVDRPRPSADGPAQLGLDGTAIPIKTGPYEPPDCPHQAILAAWAEVLPAMPQHKPTQWKGARADHLRARWRERAVEKRWASVDAGLADMRQLFAFVGESRFLTGRTASRDGKPPFLVTLEWLSNPGNWSKVVEGNYHREFKRMKRTCNLEAEQGILVGLMRWPDALDQVADTVAAADFANEVNRDIFAALQQIIVAGKEPDPISVHHAVNANSGKASVPLEDFIWLDDANVRRNGLRRYAEIVRQASLERALLSAVDQAAEIVQGDGGYAERLERATALLSGLQTRGTRGAPRLIRDLLIAGVDRYTELAEGERSKGWRTRIPTLDRLLGGGLRPGKVYVLAARPKVGKTSFASQITLNLAEYEELTALVLTQEMPDEELADRAVANLARVDYSSLQTGEIADWGALSSGIELGAKLPIWIDDQAGLTIADIRAKARGIKGLKLLVLDYLQLCSGSAKGDNRNTEIEQISRGVKVLAKELGIAVLMLSQLNRDVERRLDKRPHLPDLRDSGSIEQDADAVIFLWPAREFGHDGHKLVGCAIEANRSGPTGEFGLDFEGRYQRWFESDQDIRFEPRTAVARGSGRTYD